MRDRIEIFQDYEKELIKINASKLDTITLKNVNTKDDINKVRKEINQKLNKFKCCKTAGLD